MNQLTKLSKKYPSSKANFNYFDVYDSHFLSLKNKKLNILEIGVFDGDSLRIWRDYFPNANICGFDINKKKFTIKDVDIQVGNQVDTVFLSKLVKKYKYFDIIIDDGSHISYHIIKTFTFLFDYLSENGIYVIEDLHTSYFPRYGGSRINLKKKNTSMNFIKQLLDSINYENFNRPFYKKNKFDGKINSINLYQNICFIKKGNSKNFLYKKINKSLIEKIKKLISRLF